MTGDRWKMDINTIWLISIWLMLVAICIVLWKILEELT